MSREQRAKIDALLRQPQPIEPELGSAAEMRAGFRAFMAQMNVPTEIRTRTTTLGDRPAVLVEPTGTTRAGTILYFHGGSWIFGSPDTAMSLTANLVTRSGFRAFSLDYRLAPEHPYPAAIEDCLSAYRALLDGGTPPSAIAFAGDSAGGGLTVTTCLAARDAGLPLPAAIVAFSPGLDMTHTGESMETKADSDPLFTLESLELTGAMYLAGQDPHQPLLSPAILADLSGFPPILLQAGTNEMLLDDSTRLAARARAAGVDVILDIIADVPHVFQAFTGVLDEADEALDRAAYFLGQRISGAARSDCALGGALYAGEQC
ncbi:alpha/beta hydrolase [Nocardia arthritidis]|uniref:Alpha/beta hydrolase fold domain-containing protein n=1 Tax=Nocardia arthritidis TaxID=228602 RepID=A0A6G9YML5_9NOCA|nr:alpha/beta hydrolase [Nocardia arthritidis]QIS14163.1 alpha/beta hydrolase fold domain-containing protein [Nocardia arthritidis]